MIISRSSIRRVAAIHRRPTTRFALYGRGGLQISIKTSADIGPRGDVWGDVFFANDLAEALRERGHVVFIDRLGEAVRPEGSAPDDIVIHLRGLHRTHAVPGAINILWVISHPDLVDAEELRAGFDLVFAASELWARSKTSHDGVRVRPLLQATNPRRFHPGAVDVTLRSDALFLGKSRNIFRPIVKDSIEIGADLSIYGDGWSQFIDPRHIRAEFLDNDSVSRAYRSARVVLNDHWDDMKREGFLSNRLFDAAGSGAVIVSDRVAGMEAIFGSSVVPYDSADELKNLLSTEYHWPSVGSRLRLVRSLQRKHSFDARAQTLLASIRRLYIRRLTGAVVRRLRSRITAH
jgi:hypothetical protein